MKCIKNNKFLMASVSLVFTLVLTLGLFSTTRTEAKAGSFFDYFDRISINKCSVSLEARSFDWTGSAITPNVTVTYNGTTLVEDTDYTLIYSKNVDAGEGRVKVKGINNFKGSNTYSFDIIGIDLSKGGSARKSSCKCETMFATEDLFKFSTDDVCKELEVYCNGSLVDSNNYKVSTSVEDTPLYKVGNMQKYSRKVIYKITGTGQYCGYFRFIDEYEVTVF